MLYVRTLRGYIQNYFYELSETSKDYKIDRGEKSFVFFRSCVIACNSGGPCETIIDGETGYLVKDVPIAFAEKMAALVKDDKLAKVMGEAGRRRVQEVFAMKEFEAQLEALICSLCARRDK